MADEIKESNPAETEKPLTVDKEHLGNDWFGKHNFFSRLMVVAVVVVFLYVFSIPLATEYVNIAAWVFVLVFMSMLFGINSMKLLMDTLQKLKGTK